MSPARSTSKKRDAWRKWKSLPWKASMYFLAAATSTPSCLKPTLLHCSILPMRLQAEAGGFSCSPTHWRSALARDAILRWGRRHRERPAASLAGGVRYHRSGERRGSQHAQQHWVADHYSELILDMLVERGEKTWQKKNFSLAARISTDNPTAINIVLRKAVPQGVIEETADHEFLVKAEFIGENARDLNRSLLSELRRVEKKTRLRAEWTSGNTTERFFDYVPKAKTTAK